MPESLILSRFDRLAASIALYAAIVGDINPCLVDGPMMVKVAG